MNRRSLSIWTLLFFFRRLSQLGHLWSSQPWDVKWTGAASTTTVDMLIIIHRMQFSKHLPSDNYLHHMFAHVLLVALLCCAFVGFISIPYSQHQWLSWSFGQFILEIVEREHPYISMWMKSYVCLTESCWNVHTYIHINHWITSDVMCSNVLMSLPHLFLIVSLSIFSS